MNAEVPGPAPVEPPAGTRLGAAYGRLWTAATVSAVGDGMLLTSAPLLATTLTDDPRWIAGTTMALTAPFLLFGLPAGVLVDRVDRRRAMVVLDAVRALAVTCLAVTVLTGTVSLPMLYATLFVIGAGETVYRNASQAIVPAVVPAAALIPANARLVAAQNVGNQFAGPLVGSSLYALARSVPFLLDAASFLASAALLARLRLRPAAHGPVGQAPRVAPPRSGLAKDLLTGARWLWRHRLLRGLAAMAALLNLVAGATSAVLVVHAQRVLGLHEMGFGVLMASESVGAALAGVVAARTVRRVGRDRALVLVAAVQCLSYAALWLVHVPVVAGSALALTALGSVTWDVVVVALRQTLIPDQLQGRVNSVYRLVAWGSLPLGAAIAGVVAARFGTPSVFAAATAVVAVAGGLLLRRARAHRIEIALSTPVTAG